MKKERNSEAFLVFIFFLTWGLVFMDRLAMSYLMPTVERHIDITNYDVGIIGFVTAAFFAASSIIFGALSDRIGYKKRFIVPFLLGTAVFSGLGAFTSTLPQLIIVRALVGFCEGPIAPLLYSSMSIISSKKTFGRNCGFMNAGVGAIGVMLGPIFITQLLVYFSWQRTFLLSAIPTVVIAVIIMIFMKEIRTPSAKEVNALAATKAAETGTVAKKVGPLDIFRYRNVTVSCITAVIVMCAYWSMMLFAPLYLVNISGFNDQQMGWITSLMGCLYVVYCIIVPKLSDNFGRKPIALFGLALALIAPLAMFLLSKNIGSAILYVAFGGMLAATTPLYQNIVPAESIPIHYRATAIAIIQGAGDFLGGACWQLGAGKIGDLAGLPFMMLLTAILIAIAIIASRFLIESNPKKWKLPYTIED